MSENNHLKQPEYSLKVRCFSWPQVSFKGSPIEQFSSSKALALLVYLVHFPYEHARQKLVSLLWSEVDEKKGQTSLRSTLYNLSQMLPGVLEINRKTVRFSQDITFWLDTREFVQFAEQKEEFAQEKALELFQDEFLSGFQVKEASLFQNWQDENREQFNRIASSCFSELLVLYDRTQQAEKVLRWGHHSLRLEPWNETTYQQLMLAHAREGAFHQSIKLFQQCKETLQEELGVAPSPATEELYAELLQARQLPTSQLPRFKSFFVGRQKEQEQLESLLFAPSARIVTFVGMGGVGKTSLAKQLVGALNKRFLHNAHWIDLRTIHSQEQIPFAIAQAVGLKTTGKQSASEQILDDLEEKEMLLVLDNLEHMLDQKKSIPWLHSLLSRAPQVKLLITSRIALRIKDAQNISLQGLKCVSKNVLQTPKDRLKQDAQRLFVETIQHLHPHYDPEADEATITNVCEELQGLPLGIEIAAGFLFDESGEKQLTSLETLLQTLRSPWANAPEYHQNLRVVFEHSWALLSSKEQRALSGFSLFVGGAELRACEQILGIQEALLVSLVEHSLVQLSDERYQIHEAVRSFAQEKHLDAEQHQKHANYYLKPLCKENSAQDSEHKINFLFVEREFANIQKAWNFCIKNKMWEVVEHSSLQLHEFFANNGRYHEGHHWLTAVVNQWPKRKRLTIGEKKAKGAALIYAAGLGLRTENIEQVELMVREGIQLISSLKKPLLLAFAHNVLGTAFLYQSACQDALAHLKLASEMYRKEGQQKFLVRPLINLASLHTREGLFDESRAFLHEALEVSEQLKEFHAMAHTLNNLGAISIIQQDYEQAKGFFVRCISVCQDIGYDYVEASCWENLSEISLKQKRFREALEHASKSRAEYEKIKSQSGLLRVLSLTPLAHIHLKEKESCLSECRAGLKISRETQNTSIVNGFLAHVSAVLLELGYREESEELALDLLAQTGTEKQHRDQLEEQLADTRQKTLRGKSAQDAQKKASENEQREKIDNWLGHLDFLFTSLQ